ncbi:hypothetical protein [Kitasatospora sp. NBC_01302]|uniref:hypothetical protein n=1 Tax=Kitasatospora sp. NBC_01302 TaxID=2903575 RepID=UPI002E10A553|nr:hypothetical protein OG294_29090 [Kitasatospora sp. NBC_01302]
MAQLWSRGTAVGTGRYRELMVEVPWGKLASQPKVSEALIAMLVLRLRPQAFPVDGAGGDGGRDLFEYTEHSELINYEAKSFAGRMTKGRRRQVVDSLVSTARHQPDHWDLLVPIDANPSEQQWFDGLRSEFPFVRHWRGLSWLNAQIAAFPDLVRYSLHSTGDEILQHIAESRAERDALMRGVPDFATRYAALATRAQEISPHYSLRATTAPDGTPVVEIVPKTQHIPTEELISFSSQVFFKEGNAEHARLRRRFERVIRFGGDDVHLPSEHLRDVTVNAPTALGISGPGAPGELHISAPRVPLDPPAVASVIVRAESGLPVASLQVRFIQRSTGTSGGCLYGTDSTGLFETRLRLDALAERMQFRMTFIPPDLAMPSAYVPTLRLMAQMLPGRSMELAMGDRDRPELSEPIPDSVCLMPPEEARRWADAFDNLARLQSLTGHFFPVPDGFTLRDARDVEDALALLNGGRTRSHGGTASLVVVRREALDRFSAVAGPLRMATVYECIAYDFGGHRIDLGPMVEEIHVERFLNLPQALRQFDEEGEATVQIQLAEEDSVVQYLGSNPPA